jgi:hypothetical protein
MLGCCGSDHEGGVRAPWAAVTLTGWLVVLGVAVVAAVLAHGIWNARRLEPRRGPQRVPVPATTERREPSLGGESPSAQGVPAAAQPAAADGGGHAVAGTPVEGEAPATAPTQHTASGLLGSEDLALEEAALRRRAAAARIDALIDAIVTLTLDAPVSAEFALMHVPPSRRAGSKPFLIEGLDTETGEWAPLTPGRHYGELQAGVQLANRHGPLNEIEYSEFVQKIEALAQAIGATPDVPDMLDVVARARELDQFAAAHDAQLAVRLVAKATPWAVGFLKHNAGRHGFVEVRRPGRLVLRGDDADAPPVLTLSFDPQADLADEPSQAVVREATLSFDVPQTSATAEPFATWQSAARALESDLDAQLVDDAGRPLPVQSFAAIHQELGQLYAQLDLRDLGAGSPAAQRLFS